eukprot:1840279-Amphidinium_carterae.2
MHQIEERHEMKRNIVVMVRISRGLENGRKLQLAEAPIDVSFSAHDSHNFGGKLGDSKTTHVLTHRTATSHATLLGCDPACYQLLCDLPDVSGSAGS